MRRKMVVEETFFVRIIIHQHMVWPPPAASLRVGRQQDLAPEEHDTIRRMTGLEVTFLKLIFTSTGSAASLPIATGKEVVSRT